MFNHYKSLIRLTRKPLLGTSFSYPDPVPGCLWDCYILTSEVTEVVRFFTAGPPVMSLKFPRVMLLESFHPFHQIGNSNIKYN